MDVRPLSRRQALIAGTATLLAAGGCRRATDATSGGAESAGILRVAQIADIAPKGLLSQNANNFALTRLVFNTLTEYDPATGRPRPALATSWEWADNGPALTLRLRDDVRFHTGRPFTARDVIASIEAMRDPARSAQLSTTAELVTDMSERGRHEVVLRLAEPVGNIFDLFELMPVIDEDTLAELASGNRIVGTGPFTLTGWTAGEEVVLDRNPHYFKPGKPYLDGVRIRTIPQLQSLVASLRTGQSHLIPGLSPIDVLSLAGDDRFRTTFTDTGDNAWYLGCNLRVPPLDRPEVRRAISAGIDRERIRQVVFRGAGTVSSLPWPQSSPAYRADLAGHYRHDPDSARRLLGEVGHTAPRIELAYNSSLPATGYMAQMVQYDLSRFGLNIELLPLLGNDFGTRLSSGKLPGLWINTHGFGHLNPASLVTGAAPFRYTKNTSGFVDTGYAEAAQRAWTATGDTAGAAYDELSRILLDQQFVISMVNTGATLAATTRLAGLSWNRFDALNLDETRLG